MNADQLVLQAIGYRLKISAAAAREVIGDLESAGVHMRYIETTGELCTNCATHYSTESGFCVR